MTLLSPVLLRQLDALSRRLRMGPAAGQFGAAASRAHGGFREFADRRNYVVGDDVRQIDWMAYARGGQPVVKRFHTEESNNLRLLLDGSASMATGTPLKFLAAQRACAALGYLALAAGYHIQLYCSRPRTNAEPELVPVADLRGKAAAGRLLTAIEGASTAGTSPLTDWIAEIVRRNKRAGALFIFSDLLCDGPLLETLNQARHAGHDIALIHVLSPQEMHPTLRGDVTLRCVETQAELELNVDREQLRAYERKLHAWLTSLSEWARRSAQVHARLTSDDELLPLIRQVLESRAQAQ